MDSVGRLFEGRLLGGYDILIIQAKRDVDWGQSRSKGNERLREGGSAGPFTQFQDSVLKPESQSSWPRSGGTPGKGELPLPFSPLPLSVPPRLPYTL